ncbi:MAG TPA: alkaline phosphatase family protein [Bryobacteraceae bacterium]|nr:alkaline phosphatase family protein [Bryobacteraceae bacterium]
MTRFFSTCLLLFAAVCPSAALGSQTIPKATQPIAQRVVILKVDGLNADLLYRNMRQTDAATGKSILPWFTHIFAQGGAVFENFYTRGISLSAPSWSILDTGRHTVIRGNVEWDRFTGYAYDYLNFFPFYLSYARSHQVDMPGVQVLDRAGIPLLIDAFPYSQRYQSFQLYQRGARWTTLKNVLARRFSSEVLIPMLENAGTPSLDEILAQQTEKELLANLRGAQILYLDDYTGNMDHEGHAINDPAALLDDLRRLDSLAGRIWTGIQSSPLAARTIFVVVSDHGMNNVPEVHSEAFSLPDLLTSPAAGAHHVMLNRHELSDYKIRGLNPLVKRAFVSSTASFYLASQAERYPTAWLDLDGNERASVSFRNSDLNKIHILLLQLSSRELTPKVRLAATTYLVSLIDKHRSQWSETASQLDEEMQALEVAIEQRKALLAPKPAKWTREQEAQGEDKISRRQAEELSNWQREHEEYRTYAAHLRALLTLHPDPTRPFSGKISEFVPEMSLGDSNTLYDLQHYAAGPGASGLVLDSSGHLDEEQSFRYVNYFPLFAAQRVRNNPQPALSSKPIDFTALRLPPNDIATQTYWLYASDDDQLLIHADSAGNVSLQPVSHLVQAADGSIQFTPEAWHSGLPLHLFEDPELKIPAGGDRAAWLFATHSEREWLEATHLCKYSDGVIGTTEELSPIAANVPGTPGLNPVLLRYERRRRELVQPDIEIFAADHWNFNVRNFNPGGNHGAFFRISTHSVWMIAGAGIPTQVVSEPYDSLNFASTILQLAGRPVPMPDRIVNVMNPSPAAP